MEGHQKWPKKDDPTEMELYWLHRLMWTWLAENDRPKKEWTGWLAIAATGRFPTAMQTHCFACELATIRYKNRTANKAGSISHPCHFCPIPEWQSTYNTSACLNNDSLYQLFMHPTGPFERRSLALAIRDAWPDPADQIKVKEEAPKKIDFGNVPKIDASPREWHIAMWDFLAKNPDRIKSDYPFDKVKNQYPTAFHTGCFACEQAIMEMNSSKEKSSHKDHKCFHCPIRAWRAWNDNTRYKCERDSASYYSRWKRERNLGERMRLAELIRDAWPESVFKIESNKYYKTRGGELAYVYYTKFINIGGAFPVGGAIRRSKGNWYLATWTDKGRYISSSAMGHEDDLVSLVEKPDRPVMKDPPDYD